MRANCSLETVNLLTPWFKALFLSTDFMQLFKCQLSEFNTKSRQVELKFSPYPLLIRSTVVWNSRNQKKKKKKNSSWAKMEIVHCATSHYWFPSGANWFAPEEKFAWVSFCFLTLSIVFLLLADVITLHFTLAINQHCKPLTGVSLTLLRQGHFWSSE